MLTANVLPLISSIKPTNMEKLTAEQIVTALKNGVKAYYLDLIHREYPYSSLVNTIVGVEGSIDDLKTTLSAWKEEETDLLTLIEGADVESIYDSYSKEVDDADMIEKFASSISFTAENQKYAFLSAINAIV